MSNPDLQVPKGTRDLSGSEARAFTLLEEKARHVFARHGFEEIRTPIFESAELFSRSLGAASDVVEKEMFTFTDRGERTFALRPEGTAGVVRHYIENSLWTKSGVHRFFYSGPMFRAERPQAGRFRQFWQIGSEHFGSADAAADADTVVMAAQLLQEAGLSKFETQVNSLGCAECRPKHREALLKYLQSHADQLTEESKKRMASNPLRVLDSKVDGPKLKDAPVMKDFLCDACRKHHEEFLALVKTAGVKTVDNPRLVRGLDYYSRTVFEFVSADLGAQSAVAAGGRYDDLVRLLGGPATPAVGFALGMDRVIMAAAASGAPSAPSTSSAVVIPLDAAAVEAAFSLSHEMRKSGVTVPPVSSTRKMKNQLSAASDSGAKWAVIIGEDELKSGKYTLKNLETREQIQATKEEVVTRISNHQSPSIKSK